MMTPVIDATEATAHQRCYGCGLKPDVNVEIGHRFVAGAWTTGNSHLIPLCFGCGKKLHEALEGVLRWATK